jgi:arginyl-tRNA synthetase
MNVLSRLRAAFALATPTGGDPAAFAAAVRPSTDPKFGDYQANGCMALKAVTGRNPRDLASEVAARVQLAPLAGPPEVAGPGFLNVRLHDAWIAEATGSLLRDEALGVVPTDHPQTLVIDFSSPNVAKPLHVGHIRSTVIGDALARVFATLGHSVVRDNHLGDWGTQFGMILWGWKNALNRDAYDADPVAELARLYRLANQKIQEGETSVQAAARDETVKLHAGDPENRALWEQFMPQCLDLLHAMYDRLGVSFDEELGESAYEAMLPGVVEELESKGLAVASQGATAVFVEGHEAPFLVRKSDGAFTYATTDLATIRYRADRWQPSRILYVVDTRQGDHFKMLFDVARRWGYDSIDLIHVGFGTILGPDRRPYKTKSGDTVGLESLLDEAVARARKIVDDNSPELDESERAAVAEAVGLGAIKYADLSQNRLSDYVFDYDRMMALTGNTATYLQYAHARVCSIFRRGGITPESIREKAPAIVLSGPQERALALQLLRLPEALEVAASELKPNVLTDYLFELANRFSTFFEACPVLKADSDALRDSRLALCDLTARVLRKGLDLLGIVAPERM